MWIYIAHCHKVSNALSEITETRRSGLGSIVRSTKQPAVVPSA